MAWEVTGPRVSGRARWYERGFGGLEESLPETGEADVDEEICTAAGYEENTERGDWG